jgi:hypothetical protein
MAEHQVLFCPFCRESFERQSHCPEHELSLVRFDELTANPLLIEPELEPDEVIAHKLVAPDDRLIALLDPRWGRGPVAAGALLLLVSLGLSPFALPGFDMATIAQLARTLPSLWTPLLVAFTVLFSLARRRTRRRLRSLRVLVPLLALLSPLTLAWAIYRLGSFRESTTVQVGSAAYVLGVASVLLLVGGLRLGGPLSKPA